MTFKMVSGLRVAACITIAGGLLACSSTNSSGVTSDGGGTVFHPLDSGGAVGDDDDSGTTGATEPGVGEACTTNADCTPDGGAPGGQCSNDSYKVGPVYPTPVCLSTCTAAADPSEIAFCGTQANPGLCQPGQSGNPATCLPYCSVTSAGVVTGCLANDACYVQGAGQDLTTSALVGIGTCQPGCTADPQCPTGSKCNTFLGACETTVTPPTEAFGSSCNPATDTACACLGKTSGFCTSACVTGGACPTVGAGGGDGGTDGGTASALPFVCSAQLFSLNELDAGISFTTQPAGLAGYCFQACDTAADCTSFGSGALCTPDPSGGQHVGICSPQ